MCLRVQGIDNDKGGVGGGRWARGLSDNDRGVGGGRGIDDAYEGLKTTMEAAGGLDKRPEEYMTTMEALAEEDEHKDSNNDNRGVGRGYTTRPRDRRQLRSVDFPCYCVDNSNTVLSLYRRCLVLILFSSDSFFFVHCKKYYQYCNHAENNFYQVYTNLAYVPSTYRRVKNYEFSLLIKTYIIP